MEHVIYDETARFSVAAEDTAAADAQSRHDLAALDLIGRAKAGGATWTAIGATLGMTGREAKRHAHKLTARTRQARLPA